MKKRNLCLRRLSMLIAFLMLIVSMPFTIQAMAMETTENIVEVEEYREEYTKHFLMPDGTYKAVTYDAPVHRMDENGVWQDIDNTMSEKAVKNKQAYITSDERAIFSKKINETDNTVFELNENGYSIKLSFVDDEIKNTSAKLSNHAKKYEPQYTDDIETQYKKLKEIDNNTTVTYKNVLKGVDLEYILSANDIKENIIITKKCDEYSYTFRYELSGLGARLNEDGSVSLYDINSNAEKYSIPAPYMYDDAGEISYDVAYTLNELGGSIYELTVTANEEWINASEREFPVTVDPTVEFVASLYDTYIDSTNPDQNNGFDDDLYVSSTKTVFMRINNYPTIAENAVISSATINAYYYYVVSSGYVDIEIFQVAFAWVEQLLTWNIANSQPLGGIVTTGITSSAVASTSINATNPGIITFNVSELMQAWYAGIPNYGIALKYVGGTNSSVIIKSWDAGAATRAYYEMTYSIPSAALPIQSGIYFIQNSRNEFFLQPDNSATNKESSNLVIEAFPFSGDWYQQWELRYLYNGYYSIISPQSGKAISVPTSTLSGSSLIQEAFGMQKEKQWKITSTSNGRYKIESRDRPQFCITANNTDVYQSTYQSDTSYSDEWNLHLEETYVFATLPIRIFYDQSALSYQTVSEMTSLFQTAAAGIKETFYINFSLQSISLSTQLNCDSSCQASDNSEICNSGCGNPEDCSTSHHRSAIRLINSTKSNTIYTCNLVGYAICLYDDGNHKAPMGVSYSPTHKDTIVSLRKSQNPDEIIQHELSHNLGANDEECSGNSCIMNYSYYDLNNWCNVCKGRIREYIQTWLT